MNVSPATRKDSEQSNKGQTRKVTSCRTCYRCIVELTDDFALHFGLRSFAQALGLVTVDLSAPVVETITGCKMKTTHIPQTSEVHGCKRCLFARASWRSPFALRAGAVCSFSDHR
jgi:hypothetical protein